jgi:TPR repeat protein
MNDSSSLGAEANPDWEAEPDLERLRRARAMLKGDQTAGLRELADLADRGSLMSMVYLGWAYCRGEGVDKNLELGESWLRRAMVAGSALASFHLGMLYKEKNNLNGAFEAFSFGADHNFAASMYRLGVIYRRGYGVAPNREKARELWKKAASYGHAFAMRNLAFCMISGECGISMVPRGVMLWLSSILSVIRISAKDPQSYLIR